MVPRPDAKSNFAFTGITREAVVEIPTGYRCVERRTRLGEGDDVRHRALETVLTWGVKTRAGFRVRPSSTVALGARFLVTLGPVREPVEVSWVVDEPGLAGFGYATLHGHPLRGEEAFLIASDASGVVWFVNRSVSRPASPGWMVLSPALRLAQSFFVRRYGRVVRTAASPHLFP